MINDKQERAHAYNTITISYQSIQSEEKHSFTSGNNKNTFQLTSICYSTYLRTYKPAPAAFINHTPTTPVELTQGPTDKHLVLIYEHTNQLQPFFTNHTPTTIAELTQGPTVKRLLLTKEDTNQLQLFFVNHTPTTTTELTQRDVLTT